MSRSFKIFYIAFSLLIISTSLLLEFDIISVQNLRLKKLKISEKDKKDHSFVFIIPSYNCADVTKKTLKSIFNQTYPNFRAIYIDDASTDLSYEIAKEFAKGPNKNRLFVQRNEKRKGAIECLYEAVQKVDDDEIVIFMKGNTWLNQKNALENIHKLYRDYDVWLAYTQHINFRTKEKGGKSAWCFSKNCLRRKSWGKPRLKTFYASLFKKIKLQDFFFRGKFISDTYEEAYMFPLMEMAGNHVAYISEPFCAYIQRDVVEEERPCNISPKKCRQRISTQEPYERLVKHPSLFDPIQPQKSDLIIFSYNRPLQLYSLLESIERYVSSIATISIIYRTSNSRYDEAYKDLIKAYANIVFYKQEKPYDDFKKLLMEEIFRKNTSNYVLFSPDDIIVKEPFDLAESIQVLENAQAYLFSMQLGRNIDYSYREGFQQAVPHHVQIADEVFGWQMDAAKGDWAKAQNYSMTLYRKKDLIEPFENIHFKTPFDFISTWKSYRKFFFRNEKRKRVGLAYNFSKVVALPLGILSNHSTDFYSSSELLAKYESGLKINIDPLFKVFNHSIYMEYQPTFVKRKPKNGQNNFQNRRSIHSTIDSKEELAKRETNLKE